MKRYVVIGDQAIISPTDTCLTLQSTTAVRPRIFMFQLGCATDVQDVQIRWQVQRFTVDDGTGTAVTPIATDPADPASVVVVQDDHTVEPSAYTANAFLFDNMVNSRAIYTWVAAHPGAEMVLPAVATEGVGFLPVHGTNTSIVRATVYFIE